MLASGPWRKWEWMSRMGPPHSDDKGLCARNIELAVTTAAIAKNSLLFIIKVFHLLVLSILSTTALYSLVFRFDRDLQSSLAA
jgi:hypothetical protein